MPTEQNIYTALLRFHSILKPIQKSSVNPFFKSKYAGLPEIQKAIAEPLQQSGLIIVHQLGENNTMQSSVVHADSGSSITSTFKLFMQKNDSQAWGSAITYAKRYAIGALLNLCIDEDDDGNATKEKPKDRIVPNTEKYEKALEFLMNGGSIETIKSHYHITSSHEQKLQQDVQQRIASEIKNATI